MSNPTPFTALVSGNPYPGRGIIVGQTPDGRGVFAYFIMGRSENSRNRIFVEEHGNVRTAAFDESKMTDPSLVIYYPIRRRKYGNGFIITNGDQTDTIFEGLDLGKTMSQSLTAREFEPDAPNFTPRISAITSNRPFAYEMSILKSTDGGATCERQTFSYAATAGIGHFIHTYETDGNPLPSFTGEPKKVAIPDSIDEFANEIWNTLNADNKISLYVRYMGARGERQGGETRVFNKNERSN